jgi:UDP-N-acetylglucosamine 2-epimerase (non-hydrolysing)
MNKTIVTITGIRPDFIRMSEIFKKLDDNFNHILVHTGQHYDELLSNVFFQELEIRKPDYILNTGKESSTHYEQLSYLSIEIFRLFQKENIKPDLIMFLGDSNTAAISLPLKKEGYRIGHIEAGMRSGDKRMLEEINRTVCDHCSDILFVYHDDYKTNLEKENIKENVYVVGNTITEVCQKYIPDINKREDAILLDIHRPENFKYKNRLRNIIEYANLCIERYNIDVYMLKFFGAMKYINEFNIDLGKIKVIDLLSFKNYIQQVYHCKFIISDSGTGQEEPALMKTPVIVPRDYTERPQSVDNDCSYMLDVNINNSDEWNKSFEWLDREHKFGTEWLGDGKTSDHILNILMNYF